MSARHMIKLSALAAGVFALSGCATVNYIEGDCITASETHTLTADTRHEIKKLATAPEQSAFYQNHLKYMQQRDTPPACLRPAPQR